MYTFIHSFSHCGGSVFKVKFPVYDKIRTLKARFFLQKTHFRLFRFRYITFSLWLHCSLVTVVCIEFV